MLFPYTHILGQLTYHCIPGFPCDISLSHIPEGAQLTEQLRTKHSATACCCFYSSQANAGGESQVWVT